jgi:hypothetical protein
MFLCCNLYVIPLSQLTALIWFERMLDQAFTSMLTYLVTWKKRTTNHTHQYAEARGRTHTRPVSRTLAARGWPERSAPPNVCWLLLLPGGRPYATRATDLADARHRSQDRPWIGVKCTHPDEASMKLPQDEARAEQLQAKHGGGNWSRVEKIVNKMGTQH